MERDIEKYQREIREFISELCRVYYQHSQPEDRSDIHNEVALIALKNGDKATDLNDAQFLGWLHEIARNVVRNWSRREGKIAKNFVGSLDDETSGQNFADALQSDVASPETLMLSQERTEMIQHAIAELSVPHQQVVWLFYVEELPEKGIAKRLGIRKGTVKSRLHHARKHLATHLEAYIF